MRRVLPAAMAASAGVLAMSILASGGGPRTDAPARPGAAATAAAAGGRAAARPVVGVGAGVSAVDPVAVDRILARPLLSPTRRPAPVAAVAVGGPAGLPRLTGVIISGRDKIVIFAGDAGAKPVSVGEGGRVGDYVVQAIAGRQATITGPDGTHVVTPTFDGAAAPPPLPVAPQPTILELLRQTAPSVGVPGMPQPMAQPPR